MSYRRFDLAEIEIPFATLAKVATLPTEAGRTVAKVATVAGPDCDFSGLTVATVATVAGPISKTEASLVNGRGLPEIGEASPQEGSPKSGQTRPAPGIVHLRPAVAVSAREYDAHLIELIAAAPEGSAERSRLAYVKTRGWVVPRGDERIFTRGR